MTRRFQATLAGTAVAIVLGPVATAHADLVVTTPAASPQPRASGPARLSFQLDTSVTVGFTIVVAVAAAALGLLWRISRARRQGSGS